MRCLFLLLVTIVTLSEARVVFHYPDLVEVEKQNNPTLYIIEPSIENTFVQELQEMEANDEGKFTDWMNMDYPATTGDYEWLRDCRYREYMHGKCEVPCPDDSVIAMEVDVPESEEDTFIVESCLDLEDQAIRPSKGFFCMNTDQRNDDSKCMNNPVCQQKKYMGERCTCPDFQVRYFCKSSEAKREEYCEAVKESFEERRKKNGNNYLRQLEEFLDESKREIKAKNDKKVNPEPAQGKTEEQRLLALLRELVLKERKKA